MDLLRDRLRMAQEHWEILVFVGVIGTAYGVYDDFVRHRKCPHCLAKIEREAGVCRHCGRDVPVEERNAPPAVLPQRPKWIACKACGYGVDAAENFCSKCKAPIERGSRRQ